MSWWVMRTPVGGGYRGQPVSSTFAEFQSANRLTAQVYVSKHVTQFGASVIAGGPFKDKATADKFLADMNAGGFPGASDTIAQALGVNVPNPLAGVAAIGDLANRLTQKNTWVRVGEVIAGLILLYVGLNAMAKDTAVGNAVQAANQSAKHAGEKLKGIGMAVK